MIQDLYNHIHHQFKGLNAHSNNILWTLFTEVEYCVETPLIGNENNLVQS